MYLDPVFVWLRQCSKLLENGKELLWQAQILQDKSGDCLFGAGVQFGLLMRAAQNSIPFGGVPALMNLSWDGGETGFAARSACPITLQVMNTNCGSKHAVGLLAYLPKIEVSQVERVEAKFKAAECFLLQTCIGMIVSLIEKYAQHGFTGEWENKITVSKNIFVVSKHIFIVSNHIFIVLKHIFVVSIKHIFVVSTKHIFAVSKHIFVVSKHIFVVSKHIFIVSNHIFIF